MDCETKNAAREEDGNLMWVMVHKIMHHTETHTHGLTHTCLKLFCSPRLFFLCLIFFWQWNRLDQWEQPVDYQNRTSEDFGCLRSGKPASVIPGQNFNQTPHLAYRTVRAKAKRLQASWHPLRWQENIGGQKSAVRTSPRSPVANHNIHQAAFVPSVSVRRTWQSDPRSKATRQSLSTVSDQVHPEDKFSISGWWTTTFPDWLQETWQIKFWNNAHLKNRCIHQTGKWRGSILQTARF